jgi:tetratricopeptide (TPR) repeat protein
LRTCLAADPCDYEAINALAELPNVEESEIIDVLMSAFELEQEAELVKTLGTTLAARLLLLGRWHTARETVDRVLALDPNLLPALMLLAETHERRKSWGLAAEALDRIGDHSDASARIRLEALRRLTTIQVLHLQSHEEARGTAERIAALPLHDELTLRAKLEIDILLDNDEAAAKTLGELTGDLTGGDPAPVDDLLRLASLQDDSLNDPFQSVATLTRIAGSVGHTVAVPALRSLGERTKNWEGVREALEDALENELDAPWECALRRRLAQVLREHLGRSIDALLHEKHILELDPSAGPTAERAAQSVTSREPADAIAHHRRTVIETPGSTESYRALRNLFLAEDDRDAAFCAEAVLVGLGAANDEEEYFYRQRRAKHVGSVSGSLSPVELAMLFPERDEFIVRVFKTIDSLIPRMFPFDMAGYGIKKGASSDIQPAVMSVVTQIATLFSLSAPRAAVVSRRLGPCVELDDEHALLLLPRTIEEAPPREQQFVCGALLARPAFGGAATDPRRLAAFTDAQLEQLLVVALAIGDEENAPDDETAVYLDMRQRLSGALGHISLRRLESLAAEAPEAAMSEDRGVELRRAMNRASARAAVLCTGDPAVAITCAVSYAGMFEAGTLPERRGAGPIVDKLPKDFHCGLGFAVSETHAKLRHRLFEADDG